MRRLATISAITLGLLSVLVAGALIWTSSLLQEAVVTVNRDTRSMMIADELQLSLLNYQRVSNLLVATPSDDLARLRAELEGEMGRLLADATVYVGDPQERELLREVPDLLAEYRRQRALVETRGLGVEQVAAATQQPLNEAVEAIEVLRQLNEAQVEAAHSRALRVNRVSNLGGTGAATLLVLALVALVVGVFRLGVIPIVELEKTLRRFRGGDWQARAAERGPSELLELARRFNEMADALARARQDQLAFLAGVAHDLRNPLGGLALGIHALEREQTSARRARTVALLSRQVDGLTRMVEDLLETTRIEAGGLELHPATVNLRQAAEDVIRLYAPTAPKHQIQLVGTREPALVRADPLRVEQVIGNLISNAIKFSPNGGQITIAVETEGDGAAVVVSDRGVGIHPSEMPDLFVPFRRKHPDVAFGSGLGLSVVQRIVEAHGGGIDVVSEPGEGSMFRVRLPTAGPPDHAGGHLPGHPPSQDV